MNILSFVEDDVNGTCSTAIINFNDLAHVPLKSAPSREAIWMPI